MPINTLPVELLGRVLRYSYGPFAMFPGQYCLGRDTAYRVCWDWRNVSVSDREVWSKVYFNGLLLPGRVLSETAASGELHVIIELGRPTVTSVGVAPEEGTALDTTLATSLESSAGREVAEDRDSFVTTLCDHLGDFLSRTTYLHISVPSVAEARSLCPSLRVQSAPSLRTLILENIDDTFLWNRVLATAPKQLRALSLTNVLLSKSNRELYANLRVLSLSFTQHPPDVPTIYALLARTSRLEFLHLGELAFQACPDHRTPTLPLLTHLQFDQPYFETAALVAGVKMPALTSILLDFASDDCVDSFSDPSSFPFVRNLVLRMDTTSGVSLGRVVAVCPNVETAEISVEGYNDLKTPTDAVLASFQYLNGKLQEWWPYLTTLVLTRWDLDAEELLPIFAGRSGAFAVFFPVAGDNGRGVMNRANVVDGAVQWALSTEVPAQVFYYKTGFGDGI